MTMGRETFKKTERLCSHKIITRLFESGNIFYFSFFKVIWLKYPDELPSLAQVAFSVSKKGFRLAVTRNLLKRRLREAYRKNKQILYNFLTTENIRIVFIVIFRNNKVQDYQLIEKSLTEMLEKLIINITENEKNC